MFLQETYARMRNVTSSLVKKINEHTDTNFSNESLVLLLIYHKCKMLSKFLESSNRPFMTVLLKSLVLDKSSYDSNKILFSEFGSAIEELFQVVIQSAIPLSEYVYAVPIVHLVTEQCNPFETLQSTSWDFKEATKR